MTEDDRSKRPCFGGGWTPEQSHKDNCVFFWYDCSGQEYSDGNRCQAGMREDGDWESDWEDKDSKRRFDCPFHITVMELKKRIDEGAFE